MADVKFSELTALTTPASADVLAIVDTDASTSKKISIDTLFGVVPVNIAVDDATDSTSATTGSIQTDGGLGVAKKLYVTDQITSANQQMILGATAAGKTTTITTASTSAREITFPDADITVVGTTTTQTLTNKTLTSPSLTTPTITTNFTIGSATITEAELEILDGATATTAELNILDGSETTQGTVTLVAADGVVISDGDSMTQCLVSDFDTYMTSTTQTLTNKTLTSPVLTTPQINDTSSDHQYVFAASELAADRVVTLPLLPSADEFTFNAMTQTLTNKTVTSGLFNTKLQAGTNAADVTLNQFDGVEVARVTDGAVAITGFTLLQTAKGGFGHRRPVIAWATADTSTSTIPLTASGSIIVMDCSANYADLITLPAVVAADVGAFYTFVVGTAMHGSATVKILTASQAGGQGFQLDAFNAAGGSGDEHTRTAWAAGNDYLTIPVATPVGTTIDLVCVVGGAGTMWLATSYTTGVTIAVGTS